MARTPKPSGQRSRRVAERKTSSVFVIFTEGKVTEPSYFSPLISELNRRENVDISLEGCYSSPSSLVRAATNHKMNNARETSDLQIWCVFDVESPDPHSDLERAMSDAKHNKINLAISNPCFELWLILHHQNQDGPITTKKAKDLRHNLDNSQGSEVSGEVYRSGLPEAMGRAKGLTSKHNRDGNSVPDNNPSSDVYLMLEAMGIHDL